MALQYAKRTASRLALQCASVREAHCAHATVARLVTFESLKWEYSFATNSALFMKLGSLLYVRCRHRSAKSTAVSNKTFLFQVTNIYLFCVRHQKAELGFKMFIISHIAVACQDEILTVVVYTI